MEPQLLPAPTVPPPPQVLKCHDFRTNRMYAVKIIRNKKRFHHQALVELKVLKYLVEEDPNDSFNVVHMQVGGAWARGRGGTADAGDVASNHLTTKGIHEMWVCTDVLCI